jgi:lipopolysaccharide transport protein LptA
VRCKQRHHPLISILSLAILTAISGIISATYSIAADQTENNHKQNKDIHIKADKVMADLDASETEFLGNVRVTQDKTIITAERMKVYYRDLKYEKNNPLIQESIKKIVAKNNVQIRFDNITTMSEEAVYVTDSKILTLSGMNSKMISGKNSITGSKFTFFQTTGKLIVEGSRQHPVEVLYFSGAKGFF